MIKDEDEIKRFWLHCVKIGIVSKSLKIGRISRISSSLVSSHSRIDARRPISIFIEEPVRCGAPLISVPYTSVLNVQNIRGGLVPRCVPPFFVFSRLFTRRFRQIHPLTTQGLWIAACLGSYRHGIKQMGIEMEKKKTLLTSSTSTSLDPPWRSTMGNWVSDIFFYPLNSPFTPLEWQFYPGACHELEGTNESISLLLPELRLRTQRYLNLTFALICCYAHKRGVPGKEVPNQSVLTQAYNTFLYRRMLLPINGEPSTPGDLSELLDGAPHLPLLPSMVPLIEHIRTLPTTSVDNEVENTSENEEKEGMRKVMEQPNCTLHTCHLSDFVSPASRRRRITAPTSSLFSSRRVVVCAARDLREGEELTLSS